jgi:hypothetical protein
MVGNVTRGEPDVLVIGAGVSGLHNYGHGGAGVPLSWGCALDVAAAVLG